MTKTGNVYTFGDASVRRSGQHRLSGDFGSEHSNGGGYWILTANGTVYNYGNAANFGDAAGAFGGSIQPRPSSPRRTEAATGSPQRTEPSSRMATHPTMAESRTHLNGSIIAATGF